MIPCEVKLLLTLRSYSDEVRKRTITSIKRIARGLAEASGIPDNLFPVITLKDEFTPAVYNNPELIEKLRVSFENTLGKDNVLTVSPVMAGEDFGMYGRVDPIIPSALFWLGSVNKKKYDNSLKDELTLPSLHSPFFLPDAEIAIPIGVRAFTNAAIDLFNE